MALVLVSPGSLNTLAFVAAQIAGWVFLAPLALLGAILIGMFISHRLFTHGGFTPFEEEMLRMRKEAQASHEHLLKLREEVSLMRVEMARLRRDTKGSSPRDEHAREEAMAGGLTAMGESSEGIEELGR